MNLEKRVFAFAFGLLLFALIMVLLTSCSPYDALRTQTPAAARPAAPAASAPAAHLQAGAKAATPLPTCTVSTGVPAGRLNIRTGPGTNYAVIRVLTEGEILKVLERVAWLKVIDEQGNQGFVSARYCK
jgi:uncharacterized protein YraI